MPKGTDMDDKSALNMHGKLGTPFDYPCNPPSGTGSSTALAGQDTAPFDKPESGSTLISKTRDSVGGRGPGPGSIPQEPGALATPMYGDNSLKGARSESSGYGPKGQGGIAGPFNTVFGG